MLSYEEILTGYRKGLRNGNWRKLIFLNKALFRALLWYAKHRGNIVNTSLVEKLSALVEKLKETKGMRIFKKGFERSIEMLNKCEEGVFVWAPPN
jgi:CRISPR/Cas system CSM-associated protein Csm2 small subunit